MRMYDVIKKKRDHGKLDAAEINFWLAGYVKGEIPDYQSAALLMALFLNGMDSEEILALTQSMVGSGEKLDLRAIDGIKVDKHSTGGVGDKTTLVLAPLLAACGYRVAKLSGRGLGHTGGTLDKLASVPGFRYDFGGADLIRLVRQNGLAVIGQSKELVPADRLLYALRDVTATVDSVPLIAASIMSKKLAMGCDVLVLDVKYGDGAFVQTPQQAVDLAQAMVAIGTGAGLRTAAVISNMETPLGNTVGNALELREAVATLQGGGPADLRQLVLALASEAVCLADTAVGKPAAVAVEREQALAAALDSGQALAKFLAFVQAQGGHAELLNEKGTLPQASLQVPCCAETAGYMQALPAQAVGLIAMSLGAGRRVKEEEIDPAVGVELTKKPGDWLNQGEIWAMIHANDGAKATAAVSGMQQIVRIGREKPTLAPLVFAVVDADGLHPTA